MNNQSGKNIKITVQNGGEEGGDHDGDDGEDNGRRLIGEDDGYHGGEDGVDWRKHKSLAPKAAIYSASADEVARMLLSHPAKAETRGVKRHGFSSQHNGAQ
ncbi:hypothetical protein Tco_0965647 [Tanacetum coccineum]